NTKPILFLTEETKRADVTTIQVSQPFWEVYWDRFYQSYNYLKQNPVEGYVWLTDTTDVQMLHNPFPHMNKGILYVGYEPLTINSNWLIKNTKSAQFRKMIEENKSRTLLNCGVLGGDYRTLLSFLKDYLEYRELYLVGEKNGDEVT